MNENENEIKEVNPEQSTIDALKKLKETSVSKDAYEKLNNQYKELLDSFINGGEVDLPEEKEEEEAPKRTKEQLKKDLIADIESFDNDSLVTNLDYAKAFIKYHDDLLEYNGVDCFANSGDKFLASQYDISSPKNTYEYLKKCVEKSEGDAEAFNVAFQAGLRQILPNKK